MTTATRTSASSGLSPQLKKGLGIGAIVVVLIAMGLDTQIVSDDAQVGQSAKQFSAEQYGQSEFPKVQQAISQRAAPADKLAAAIAEDKDAAVEQYGVPGDIAPVMSVKFTGTVGDGQSGIYNVSVPGVPDDITIRVQTGPAINGTALRDGVGGVSFGDFKNQIEYQNAAAGINDAMKTQVLSGLNRDQLAGKQITVVGAFQMINPKNWFVTPVRLSVSP